MLNRHSHAGTPIGRLVSAIVAVILMVGTLFFGATAAQAADQVDVEKSIVLVGTTWTGFVEYPVEGGGTDFAKVTSSSICTGWFASEEGHIVTAGHCVDPEGGREQLIRKFLTQENAMNLLQSALTNWKVDGGEGQAIDREVKAIQPSTVKNAVIEKAMVVSVRDFDRLSDGDVALLQAQGLSEKTTALAIADKKPEIRSEVTAIGFPGSVTVISDDVRPSFKTGTVSSYQVSNGVSGIEINAEIGSGMSGGPTINADGEVVGVNSYSAIANDEANFNFVTDTDNLVSFLNQNDVPINVVQPRSSAEPTGPVAGGPLSTDTRQVSDAGGVPMWVWFVVGALVVLGLAFWLLRKNNALPAFAGGRAGHAPAAMQTAPVPVAVQCPDGHANRPGTKFCGECGKPVGQPPVTEGPVPRNDAM